MDPFVVRHLLAKTESLLVMLPSFCSYSGTFGMGLNSCSEMFSEMLKLNLEQSKKFELIGKFRKVDVHLKVHRSK
jgi:hypothetical protein